jgi:hypothetical protein
MLTSAVKQPLTNVQLELLKSFSYQLTENELLEVRKLLATFFAQRLVNEANKTWEEKGWDDSKVDKMLNTKMRKAK